jgi:hypothetical protein
MLPLFKIHFKNIKKNKNKILRIISRSYMFMNLFQEKMNCYGLCKKDKN